MADIEGNLSFLMKQIPGSVKLIAVSKTRPAGDVFEAYKLGQRDFGENRVQEILKKKDQLPADIRWHLIGHLQTNKVKSIIPYVAMIHSADTVKILEAINSESRKDGRITDCLLQIHIAQEESKSGFTFAELTGIIEAGELNYLENIRICGVMGMATFTDDNEQVRREFQFLADCFRKLKSVYFNNTYFSEISMGMSGDYRIAIEEGSTMVRVGSLIFGERIKNQL